MCNPHPEHFLCIGMAPPTMPSGPFFQNGLLCLFKNIKKFAWNLLLYRSVENCRDVSWSVVTFFPCPLPAIRFDLRWLKLVTPTSLYSSKCKGENGFTAHTARTQVSMDRHALQGQKSTTPTGSGDRLLFHNRSCNCVLKPVFVAICSCNCALKPAISSCICALMPAICSCICALIPARAATC